jgi:hypothetical protein
MAAGLRAAVHLIAGRLYDAPSEGRSGEALATGLSVRDLHQAVEWTGRWAAARPTPCLWPSP